MAVKIMKCDCKHEDQDKMHGKGNRVFNMCKPDTNQAWRCTVCLKVKTSHE